MSLRGADIVAQALVLGGAKYVFGLSGNHIMSLIDAALDTELELVHVRHEDAAVHMADAWGRLTEKPGIALVTGGPGFANGIAALYTALTSEAPLVFLAGHAPSKHRGKGAFQEMNQADIAAPLTKASWTVRSSGDLGNDIARAMRIACSPPQGPVHVSLPSDFLEEKVADESLPDIAAFRVHEEILNSARVEELIAQLSRANHPLVLAGPAMAKGLNRRLVRRFSEVTGVPAVVMESPRGVNDPSLGKIADCLKVSDFALLIGKHVDFTLDYGKAFSPACRIADVDTRFSARTVFQQLLNMAGNRRWPSRGWHQEVEGNINYRSGDLRGTEKASSGDLLHPLELCKEIQQCLDTDEDSILVSDGGEFCQWMQSGLTAPRRLINGPGGPIGTALPHALAAQLAFPEASVYALMGDGAFGFHMSEIETAVRHKLPIVAIIGNDRCWNAEFQIQLREYGLDRARGCELSAARYDLVAEALGGYCENVSTLSELAPALARARASGRPSCVNVGVRRLAAPDCSA